MRQISINAPVLFGLVLAGGSSTRMGQDKGEIDYHGEPQVRWGWRILGAVCERVYVSVRAEQASLAVYAGLPQIADAPELAGPAAGLLAALRLAPEAAWLTLAVDMPLVDHATLAALVAGRDPDAVATAYEHPDGTAEPLCTIWEPRARVVLEAAVPGSVSLRRLLGSARMLRPVEPARIDSANSPAEAAAIRARLTNRPAP